MTNMEQYKALMTKLLARINSGNGETEEADEIRDDLDLVWRKLTDQEQIEVRRWTAERIKEQQQKET